MLVVIALALLMVCVFRTSLWDALVGYCQVLEDREKIKVFIHSFGLAAPGVFILLQILQVLLAPIPGEATGFIGGYLFGAIQGLLYSTIGLTVGSWLNFVIGRFLGKRFIRRLIPPHQLQKFDRFVKHQGIFVLLVLFVFPGFPKDYLCFFLGLSAIPLKAFMVIAAIGRIPGTFLLSLQGAFLFDRMYGLFALVGGVCLTAGLIAYRYREKLYLWVEKINSRHNGSS